ncbi:MAG: cation:proton antiporter, partial [Acidobacteria bacterium]|nr:cation:proton antiporter [Acidobacteriota bacterium]
LGIGAQVLANRLKLPAILPLLVLGMATGPFGLGLFDPNDLGPTLLAFIHLGVAVILFEGGLSLELRHLRQVGGAVRNLLLLGTAITGVGGAALMHFATGASWSTSALFGAIVTVTGPTVISPLLRHMVAPRNVRTTLLSEGLMIDPIGAVLAYLVLQWIGRADLSLRALATELLLLCVTGAVIGFVAGKLAVAAVKYRHMGSELQNLAILALLLLSYEVSEMQASESGILAAVVMGLTVSAAQLPDVNPLKHFKGQLTVLVISVLFILLSARLDLRAVADLGWQDAAVVAGLILLVRPLSVFLSVPPKELGLKERFLLAMNAPRGIVAAAVASLAAIQLRHLGAEKDAAILEGLVYLVILSTCTWSTVMAKLLPRWLGYHDDPSRRRVVLVGANAVAGRLAEIFREKGWTPIVVDSAPRKLQPLRLKGLRAVVGDAREATAYEEAGIERDTEVVAMTVNDELNLLVAELVKEEFGIEHPAVALLQPSGEFGQTRRAWVDLLSSRPFDVAAWSRRLDAGTARIFNLDLPPGEEALRRELRHFLKEQPEGLAALCGWPNGRPSFRAVAENLESFERVTLAAVDDAVVTELEERLRLVHSSVEKETTSGEPMEETPEDTTGER